MGVGVVAFNALTGNPGDFWGIANPTAAFTGTMNPVFANIVLLSIVIGSVSANILNVYSGAMSFLAMGFKFGFKTRRAIMVLLAGLAGGILSFIGVQNGDVAHQLDGFLLVVSYWVSPWIAIVVTERFLSKGKDAQARALAPKNSWAGPLAFVLATGISIWGFANQVLYTGPLAKSWNVGDLTALVGFVLAAVLYVAFRSGDKNSK
jgi:NCS1 family nucleobase:cation symporter-1